MIRFVDIRNQGIGYRFAFWSTISDKFISINGEFAWDNWNEFQTIAEESGLEDIERYRRLCPDWTNDDISGVLRASMHVNSYCFRASRT